MLDVHGFVAETNATHLFLVHRGVVMTPKTSACPEGITRAVVIELCKRHRIPNAERDLSLTEFYRADEVFCTGTMGELAGVTRIDGRTIGDGEVAETTRRLSALYGELVRSEGVPVA
jgi:branched-chain amino acid aminotransferase